MDHFGEPLDQANANVQSRGLPSDVTSSPVAAWLGPEQIKAIRRRLGITQRQFLGWFGFPLATLRHWEHGSRRPTGSALVLLSVIHENPGVVLRAVRKVRRNTPGSLAEVERLESYRAPPGFGDRPPPLRPRGPRRRKPAP